MWWIGTFCWTIWGGCGLSWEYSCCLKEETSLETRREQFPGVDPVALLYFLSFLDFLALLPADLLLQDCASNWDVLSVLLAEEVCSIMMNWGCEISIFDTYVCILSSVMMLS